MRQQDSLTVVLDDLRRHRPPVYDADRWAAWCQAIGQCIAACPGERSWAMTVLVADDLTTAMPGLNMAMAYATIQKAVEQAAQVEKEAR